MNRQSSGIGYDLIYVLGGDTQILEHGASTLMSAVGRATRDLK